MAVEVIIAIDIGSSSIRCSAYRELNIIASSFNTTSSVNTVSGMINIQSTGAKTLLDLVEECLDETLEKLEYMDETVQVVSVGFACFVMNLIGTDKNGNIIGSEATMSYACGSDEVANEVDALKRELGEEKALELYKRTGAPLHSAYAIAQLRAFYKSNSDSVSKVSQWKSICSLLLDRWTARDDTPISYSEASWCGLLNYGTCDYDDLALDLLPDACTNALPKLADFDEVPFLNEGISQRTSYWERWPLLRGSRLFLGLGDGACANIGSKCSVPNRIACTVGTSAAARVCLPCPIGLSESLNFEAGLFCYRIDRSHILLGGALNDGGNAVEWIRQLLNLQTDESFDECLKAVSLLTESDCNKGSGERSTGFRTRATGAMIDLTHATTPAHMLKSVLEGVTLRLNAIVARICQTSKSLHQSTASILVVSGKALEVNDIWRQMLANCSGIKVVFDKATQEGTSRGVAVLITRAIQQSRDRDARLYLPGETISNALIEEPVDALRGYWKHISNRQEKLLYAISDMYD